MKKLILGLGLILALGACGSLNKETLGLSNKAPNENLVTSRPPLTLPPEYDLQPVTDLPNE